MAYSVASFHAVKQQLEASRAKEAAAAEARKEEVQRVCPEAAAIDRELRATSMRLYRAMFAHGAKEDAQKKIAELREENLGLQKKRASLLVAAGFPADYTEVKYACPLCRDAGYDEQGQMCACMKRALVTEEIRRSGIGDLVDKQTFATFDLAGVGTRIETNFEICRQYAETFTPKTAENLLFSGPTGLGKTHLSTAIAVRVIERGYRVVYESMTRVTEAFGHDRFHSAEEPITGKYNDAELLILDDVGAELPGAFNTAVLYQLINERQNHRLPTIINTNLRGPELTERYDARISSRLIGGYRTLLFEGRDHRMM